MDVHYNKGLEHCIEIGDNMIQWASRCDHPIDSEGLIKVSESADSIISFIKKELGI